MSLITAYAINFLVVTCVLVTLGASRSQAQDSSFEDECLSQHNKWRQMHSADPLKIDAKLTSFAQNRAKYIADSDGSEFGHPSDLDYGENLAWNSYSSTNCSTMVKMWYDEVKSYNFNDPGFSSDTGHFTQLVWRDTKRVGCSRSISSGPRGGVYLVCNYDPPGNYQGEYQENVKPATVKKSARNRTKKPKKPKKPKRTNRAKSTTTTTTTTTPSTAQ